MGDIFYVSESYGQWMFIIIMVRVN